MNLATHVTDAVMSAFAPDAPKQLKEMVWQKERGTAWQRRHSEQFIGVVEAVAQQYTSVSNRQGRTEMLALVAPWFQLSELRDFIPGLTPYAFKEARLCAKMMKANMPRPQPSNVRESYDKKKVLLFIDYITGSQVVSDMPFGYALVKKSTGIKEEIPNLLRTATDSRIVRQFQEYMKFRGLESMLMSESTMLRILKVCKATTRKSMKGIDYITYEGLV